MSINFSAPYSNFFVVVYVTTSNTRLLAVKSHIIADPLIRTSKIKTPHSSGSEVAIFAERLVKYISFD